MRGRKPLLIFLIVPLLFLFYSCGGGGSGSSFSPPADTPGLPFSLTLLPSQSIAQTNSSIILNAKVLDGNGVPVPNVLVTFTNLSEPFGLLRGALRALGIIKPIGALSATLANTNSLGIASVSIFSSVVGFATVQAEISNSVGISRAKKTLFFALDVTPASPTLSLHADDGDGTFDEPADFILLKGANDNQRTIRADVLQGSSPVLGATVTFGTDLPFKANADPATKCSDGTNTCSVIFPNGNTSQTNQLGQAFTLLQVNPTAVSNLGTVLNVTAQTTINNQTAFNLLSLFLRAVSVDATKSFLTALPSTIDTTQTSQVTGVVFLNTGAPAPDGTSVNFTVAPKTGSDPSPCGTIDPFQQTTSGATSPATFTPPLTAGVCTVTGKVGGVAIGTVDITVTTALSVQPATQTVDGVNGATGTSAPKFQISGGIAPYTVVSDNTLFPPIVASDGKSFTANVPAGSQPVDVTYTVQDNAGTTVQVKLVITGQGTLTLVPSTLAIDTTGGSGSVTVHYLVSGGKAPYKVFFTLTSPVTPSVANGTTLPIPTTPPINQQSFDVTYSWTGVVTAETFQIIVTDSLGASQSSTITVTGTLPTPTPTPSPTPTPTPATPDFTISCAPAIVDNTTTTSTCTLTALNGFAGPVALTCNPATPTPGASCVLAPAAVVPPTTSTLTYTCGTTGTSAFTVHAVSGTLVHDFAMVADCL